MGKTTEVKVYVLCEQPRWGEEKFLHGIYTSEESLDMAKAIVSANHKSKGFAPPDFDVETVTLDEMPFDWVAYQKEVDTKA